MKSKIITFLSLLCVLIVALLTSSEVRAQEPLSAHSSTRLSNGVHVAFKTEYVAPKPMSAAAGQNRAIETRVESESNVVHRVLVDSATGSYFGYELEVEPVRETKQFRVSVKALSPEFLQRLREEGAARKNARRSEVPLFEQPLRFPAPQLIDDGDTLALDVLVNQQTGVKIVDLITVSASSIPLPAPPASGGPPRDFQVENVHLRVWNFQLLVNGQVATKNTGGCYGRLIFFYLPGRGRFVFSLTPQEGFEKIGVIEHNKISFSVGSDAYEWISGSPIVAAGGNWNLWVLHEPNYLPDVGRYGVAAGIPGIEKAFALGAGDDVKALPPSAKKE